MKSAIAFTAVLALAAPAWAQPPVFEPITPMAPKSPSAKKEDRTREIQIGRRAARPVDQEKQSKEKEKEKEPEQTSRPHVEASAAGGK